MIGHSMLPERLKARLGMLLNYPAVNALRGVPRPDVTGEAAQAQISRLIREGGRLIGRVGQTEGRAVSFYLRKRRASRAVAPPYDPETRNLMKSGAGYFPTADSDIDRLAVLYLESLASVDLYAAWTPHDKTLCPRGCMTCRLVDLEPFFTDRRWTLDWEGKRVTVVSPFARTILSQWERRDELFSVPTLAPCRLAVVQAPSTHCGTEVTGQDWYANLDELDSRVSDTEPEVVVIGAGAYGLPIGARAKARGATAIVLGGATQLLFGIMGNRWAHRPPYASLQTRAWTRPAAVERPPGYESFEIEGGAYW